MVIRIGRCTGSSVLSGPRPDPFTRRGFRPVDPDGPLLIVEVCRIRDPDPLLRILGQGVVFGAGGDPSHWGGPIGLKATPRAIGVLQKEMDRPPAIEAAPDVPLIREPTPKHLNLFAIPLLLERPIRQGNGRLDTGRLERLEKLPHVTGEVSGDRRQAA